MQVIEGEPIANPFYLNPYEKICIKITIQLIEKKCLKCLKFKMPKIVVRFRRVNFRYIAALLKSFSDG